MRGPGPSGTGPPGRVAGTGFEPVTSGAWPQRATELLHPASVKTTVHDPLEVPPGPSGRSATHLREHRVTAGGSRDGAFPTDARLPRRNRPATYSRDRDRGRGDERVRRRTPAGGRAPPRRLVLRRAAGLAVRRLRPRTGPGPLRRRRPAALHVEGARRAPPA